MRGRARGAMKWMVTCLLVGCGLPGKTGPAMLTIDGAIAATSASFSRSGQGYEVGFGLQPPDTDCSTLTSKDELIALDLQPLFSELPTNPTYMFGSTVTNGFWATVTFFSSEFADGMKTGTITLTGFDGDVLDASFSGTDDMGRQIDATVHAYRCYD